MRWCLNTHSLSEDILVFCMCQNVRLEVGRLCKLLGAAVKWTDIRPVTSMNAYMCAQVEVK